MRWQEAKPGIERAACVMRPMKPRKGRTAAYVRAHRQTGGQYAIIGRVLSPRIFDSSDGTRGFFFSAQDSHDRSRIISAPRVESAVETQTFLDICEDEDMLVTRFCGRWHVSGVDAAMVSAKSLRGAYLNYHAGVAS